jgi:hypothetical protein
MKTTEQGRHQRLTQWGKPPPLFEVQVKYGKGPHPNWYQNGSHTSFIKGEFGNHTEKR